MRTWTARKHIDADPAVVLDLLTDTDSCREWSPVPFDLDGASDARLAAGSRMRVSGRLVGRRVGFDVEVHEVGDGRLAIHDITLAPLSRTGALMGDSDLGTAIRRWRCGSAADGTDVLPSLLPSSCRGS